LRSREEILARLRLAYRPVASGQKYAVKEFEPQDAQGIAALYYAVYGENFPVDSVYDPEQIIRASADRQAHYVVGRTPSGDVVGLLALFRNPPGRHIMESGSWIVLPDYRNTTLAMRLAHGILGDPPVHLGLNVIFGQSVCDHYITQKMNVKYKAVSCALEIEAMPPRPEDAPGASGGRVTLMDAVLLLRDAPHAVHLPAIYADFLRRKYASLGAQREYVEDGEPQALSSFNVQTMDAASLVKTTVDVVGRDVDDALARLERDHPGRDVAHLFIPLWKPGASLAVDAARKAGYFLAGLLPQWDDRDVLLMQKLRGEPDYSKIQLYARDAKDMLERIVADRASLTA